MKDSLYTEMPNMMAHLEGKAVTQNEISERQRSNTASQRESAPPPLKSDKKLKSISTQSKAIGIGGETFTQKPGV